jgi:hypothetical protein
VQEKESKQAWPLKNGTRCITIVGSRRSAAPSEVDRARLRHASVTCARDLVRVGDVGGERIEARPGEPPRPSLAAADVVMLPASKRPFMTRMVESPSRFMRAEVVPVRSTTSMSSLADSARSSRKGT